MNVCPAIIASGVRTGQICARTPGVNLTYCRYHRRQEIDFPADIEHNLNVNTIGENNLNETTGTTHVSCAICHDTISLHGLAVILPCGHACLCLSCTKMFGPTKRYKVCPLCQKPITSITKLFYPTLVDDAPIGPIGNAPIGPIGNAPIGPPVRRNLFQRFLAKFFCR